MDASVDYLHLRGWAGLGSVDLVDLPEPPDGPCLAVGGDSPAVFALADGRVWWGEPSDLIGVGVLKPSHGWCGVELSGEAFRAAGLSLARALEVCSFAMLQGFALVDVEGTAIAPESFRAVSLTRIDWAVELPSIPEGVGLQLAQVLAREWARLCAPRRACEVWTMRGPGGWTHYAGASDGEGKLARGEGCCRVYQRREMGLDAPVRVEVELRQLAGETLGEQLSLASELASLLLSAGVGSAVLCPADVPAPIRAVPARRGQSAGERFVRGAGMLRSALADSVPGAVWNSLGAVLDDAAAHVGVRLAWPRVEARPSDAVGLSDALKAGRDAGVGGPAPPPEASPVAPRGRGESLSLKV